VEDVALARWSFCAPGCCWEEGRRRGLMQSYGRDGADEMDGCCCLFLPRVLG